LRVDRAGSSIIIPLEALKNCTILHFCIVLVTFAVMRCVVARCRPKRVPG
jgi:hypothetical protein